MFRQALDRGKQAHGNFHYVGLSVVISSVFVLSIAVRFRPFVYRYLFLLCTSFPVFLHVRNSLSSYL